MSQLTKDRIGDKWLTAKPIYRADLDRCEPADALTREPQRGR